MGKKILVVKDVKSSRSLMVILLRSLGYETLEAETGADAIQKAFFESSSLIVMDLGLPDITALMQPGPSRRIRAAHTSRLSLVPPGRRTNGGSKLLMLGYRLTL